MQREKRAVEVVYLNRRQKGRAEKPSFTLADPSYLDKGHKSDTVDPVLANNARQAAENLFKPRA